MTPDTLAGLSTGEDAALARLHTRLTSAAQEQDLLDVAYTVMPSPVGELLLAATPAGLVRVGFGIEGHDAVLAQLALRVSPRILEAPERLAEPVRQLEEYFAGTRKVFDLALDFRLATGFRRTVVEHLPDIGYGSTASYAALAALAGSPGAVRAAGTACARNPLPVVVPCHRVVRSDGKIGNYLGGTQAKAALLAMEAAA
ncbi:methylated-DNA--[protein]-cysteine S-methyltransferase [Arthrobacter gandavensis]|uniref:Methylated-DNA--protein-cysteine methyltransferase n=1 Tax=Arthrobacter gandavensis TaxID=169960 RepID=A0ABN2P017_9MICC|nr:methylated-DNA--[protein]-cysteine S-methyltransferase [Arthrobacter citreus]